MKNMIRRFGHIIRIFFLLLYAVYALTPVHMYAVAGEGGHSRRHTTTDIVWANVLYSVFVDDVEVSPAGDGAFTNAQQNGDMVLVKKRRAIIRTQFELNPLFDTKSLPPGSIECPSCSLKFEIAKDPILREIDSCLTLNSGLSPPFLFS